MRNKTKTILPDWARTIKAVRLKLRLSQSELAEKLETSAMAISRWERGEFEPSADAYLRLGKLMGDPLCWFFWGRAGLSTADVMRVLPKAGRRLREDRIATVQVVHAGAEKILPLRVAQVRVAQVRADQDRVSQVHASQFREAQVRM